MTEKLLDEYKAFYNKYTELKYFIHKYENGLIDSSLNCPLDLLRYQIEIMEKYLMILETRLSLLNYKL